MTPLAIAGAWLISPVVHRDPRGRFVELYRSDLVTDVSDVGFDVRQASLSTSKKDVVRGIHYSVPGQAKYVTCVRGSALDVVVDIRPDSATFGTHLTVELSDVNCQAVYLAGDLGHGFCALADDTTMFYLQSTVYTADNERAINPLELGIGWPAASVHLSDRDSNAPTLDEAWKRGLLP